MTNDQIINAELPDESVCMWQIPPSYESPNFALEMWITPENKLVLFQFFVPLEDKREPWWERIDSHARYEQVPNGKGAA